MLPAISTSFEITFKLSPVKVKLSPEAILKSPSPSLSLSKSKWLLDFIVVDPLRVAPS